MLSDYLGEKKNFAKGTEFWHVGCLGVQVVFRSLFVEQETGKLFIVYEIKMKSYSI